MRAMKKSDVIVTAGIRTPQETRSDGSGVWKSIRDPITSETIPPTVIAENGKPVGTIQDGDAVIFFNFRHDRQVQLVRSFSDPAFDKFRAPRAYLQNMYYVTMTLYDKNLSAAAAFPPMEIKMGLSEVISKNGMNQFHIAESEKYAHVTSFWNGGRQESTK